jgi:hypothetical protein
MEPIERATAHFMRRKTREIVVDQWPDEHGQPLSVFYYPLTLKDLDNLAKIEKQHGPGAELIVRTLIEHARDEKGDKLFTLEHKHALLNEVDPDVIHLIVNAMMPNSEPDDIKKKSNPTANSDSD